MVLWLAFIIAILFGAGLYLLFFPQTFDFFLGFSLLTYAVNCFVFLMGGAHLKSPPILGDDLLADPLPQALVLTAIVIGLASAIYLLVFIVTLFRHLKDDQFGHQKQKAKKTWWR